MTIALALTALITLASPDAFDLEPDPQLVDRIVARGCIANHRPNREIVEELLRIEAGVGIPPVSRGIMVAAACRESGFTSTAAGDYQSLVTGKKCQRGTESCVAISRGMMQLGRWAKRKMRRRWATFTTRDPRLDWRKAAEFWGRHIVKQVSRVRRECRYEAEIDVWKAAHRTAVTKPKCIRYRVSKKTGKQRCAQYVPRCHRIGRHQSKHWRVLASWTTDAPRAVNPVRAALVR